MGIFSKLFGKPKKLQPEDYYVVTITDEAIHVEHPKQEPEYVLWKDIHTITLINTDEGPWLPDIWLRLITNDSSCMIPNGSQGFEDVYQIISKYNGFNLDNFIKSMACADNAEFLLWTKQQPDNVK